jgi:predicted  nucleic acid-binding Zn-ribbon protein
MELFILPLLVIAGILSTGWLAIAAIVISVISTVYSFTVAQKAAKTSQDGVLITKHDNNAGLPIVYGIRPVGGIKVWKNVSKSSFLAQSGRTVFGMGDPNDGVDVNWKPYTWLDRVDVLCEGPIEGLEDIIVDNETYKAPRFRERNHAIYRGIFMDGTPGQGPLSELSGKYPEWHLTSTGERVAYVNSRFRSGHYYDEGYDSYFQGEPSCEYVVKGKLVWDPRKDVNYGGTGTHDLNDETTWEWSDNPALCLMDYLTQPYGRNLHHGELDLSTFVAAANSCDELVAIPPRLSNTSGGNVIAYDPATGEWIDVANGEVLPNYRPDQVGLNNKRLTCHAVLSPDDSVLDNVKTLLQSMRGSLPYSNGKYSLVLEAPRASSMDIGIEDIIGGITFGNGERSKRYNRVTVVFPNKNKRYREDRVSWPSFGSTEYADFLTEDNGEELFYEVQLDAITDYYQAEDIAEFICRDSRQQLQAELTIKSKGILLQPGDVVGVTHPTPGWVDRYFRVRQVAINNDHTVTLSLQEYNASTYDWADTTNEPDVPDVNLPLQSDALLPVTDLQAVISSKQSAKGIPQGYVELTWLPPEDSVVREYIVTVTGVDDTSIKFEILVPPVLTFGENTDRAGCAFTVPQDNMDYNVAVAYMTPKDRLGPSAGGTITIPQYVTDIETGQDEIESEAGAILEFEDDLGNIISADLSDLAQYYKDQEIEIDADIAQTNSTLTSQVTRLDGDIAQLQTQLGDITSGTADVYVQTTAPVAGVGGVPNPIPTNSRWYDSDDNNHPYIWNGSAWVSIQDGGVGQNEARITVLEADLTTAEGDITANATAIGVLDTTVTNIDGVVTSNSADITALQSSVNNPTTGLSALSTAVGTLETTTTQQGTDIATNATDITTLQSTVNDPTTGVVATSSAVSALDTRVTSAEGTITSQAADITSLQSGVSDLETDTTANAGAITGLNTRVETVENDINTINIASQDLTALSADYHYRKDTVAENGDDIELENGSGVAGLEDDLSAVVEASSRANYLLETEIDRVDGVVTIQSQQIVTLDAQLATAEGDILANSNATQALTTRVTDNEGDLTALSSDVTSLTSSLAATDSAVAGNASALSALQTEVTQIDGVVTANASDIVDLQVDLSDAEGDILANAGATQALTVRVTDAEGEITSNSTALTSLESRVATTETGVSGNATALNGLDTRVTANEDGITSQASSITALEADLTAAEGDISANAAATTALTTRVASAEGTLSSQSQSITALQSDLSDAESDISGNAGAISNLATRVTVAEGSITSQAQDITSLDSSLTTARGDITDLEGDLAATNANVTANANATSGLVTRVDATENSITSQSQQLTTLSAEIASADGKADDAVALATGASATASQNAEDVTDLQAEWFVKANVNGVISGIEFKADQTSSDFTIVANNFKVYNSNGADLAPFSVSNNKITMNGNVEINGGLVVNGSITGDEIANGAVGPDELTISAGDGETGERMYFNGQDNRIEIYDSSNRIRVALGELTGV